MLAILLVISLSACGEEEEQSLPEEETSVAPTLDHAQAVALLERDKLITDIFVNNYLCKGNYQEAKPQAVELGNECADFLSIFALLGSTYTESGGCITEFLNYPEGHTPSVSAVDGRTYVFNHIGSRFEGHTFASTAVVEDTENENVKIITAKTYGGESVSYKAVHKEGVWLLEEGIFRLNSQTAAPCTEEFPYTGHGSLSSLSGEVLVIELFVTDKQSKISSEQEAEFHSNTVAAMEYITNAAAKYGSKMSVSYETAYFNHENVIGSRPLDFDIIFSETGFGTLKAFAEENYDLSAYDNYLFLVCMNKDISISHAANANTPLTEIYYGERVICRTDSTASDLCVEILKLAGAYSYNEGKCSKYVESLFFEYFEGEIMLTGSLSFSEMSPVTAYACGLINDLDPLYRVFFYNE